MIKEERFERIKSELAKRGSVSGDELAGLLGVSMTTIRRDLDSLEALGCLTRTHGGATAVHVEDELPFHSKMSSYLPEKRAIGVKTASLIPDGAVIGCSGGTTVMQVIKALKDKNLMVVTNAVNVAMELASTESVQVIVTGGNLRARTFELVGPIADQVLESFHLDIALLGVDGITVKHGLSTYTVADAHTDSQYMRHAEETWVVADHSKIGRVTPALVSPLNRVKRLITDPGIQDQDLHSLESLGIEVILAEL